MARKTAWLGSCAIAAAALGISGPASAADAVAEVEEIIVTALKREQNLQDVPLSINVIERAQLENFNKSDLRGLQGSVPGLFVQTSPTNQGLYLRGFGSAPTNPAFDQSVSLFQDGLYLGRSRQFMAPFFDVERIEVLRGPQGALVGKNTAAGAISIVTANPTDTFQGSVTGLYNFSRNGGEISGFVSGPITDTLSARLAAKHKDLGGYLKNQATGDDDPSTTQTMARLTLRFAPTDTFDVTGKFEVGKTRTDGTHVVNFPANGPLRLSKRKNGAPPFGEPELDNQDGYNTSIIANLDVGRLTVTSITGFSGFDSSTLSSAAALNPSNYYVGWYEGFDQQSQEFRVLSPAGETFEFVVGAYWDHSKNKIFQVARFNVFGVVNGQAHIDFRQKATTWSVFGQGTWRVTDTLRLLGSARQTWIDKTGSSNRVLDRGVSLSGVYGMIGPVDLSEKHFDPSITGQFDLTPDIMLYATYARGSKAGGFDSANASAVASRYAFRSESSRNIEVGQKGTFFDNRLTLNLSVFRMTFDDLQVAAYVPPSGIQTTNAAAARSRGVEGTATWRASNALRFSASGAYIDAKYGDFPGAPCRASQAASVCSSTAPVGAPNNQANNNAKGLRLPFTPKWSGEIQGQFIQPLPGDLTLSLMAAARYRSNVWIDTSYNPLFGRQPAVTKIDARVEVAGPGQRWSVALVGTNLTDELTAGQAFFWPLEPGPGGQPVAGAFVDEARTVSVEGRLRF